MDTPVENGQSASLRCGGLVRLNKRAQRRKSLLMMARLAWYQVMDGHMPHDAWHMREIDNLLRRAGATRDDL